MDFDLINTGVTRFSVGAVNVRTGNFVYFDNTTHEICPEHVMASGSLPPGFPATEIQGEHYWDGGLVSNTPLQWVLSGTPRQDTLAFQIDLWNARGRLPRTLIEAELRQKEIRFSSRTRAATDDFKKSQLLRRATHHLLQRLPDELRQLPEANLLASEADEKVYNIINLIYHSRNYEGTSKDYEFSRRNNGGALGVWLQRRGAHLASQGSLATPRKSRWRFHLRPRARRPRIGGALQVVPDRHSIGDER